jgi:hypothetical protein
VYKDRKAIKAKKATRALLARKVVKDSEEIKVKKENQATGHPVLPHLRLLLLRQRVLKHQWEKRPF